MSQSHSRVGVGIIVTRSDGYILLGYRIKEKESPTWCLPGGHVEPGETFEDAARRELQEETGIVTCQTAKIFAFLQRLNCNYTSVTGSGLISIAEPVNPEVTEPEVFSEWRWFHKNHLPAPLFPASEAMLSLFISSICIKNWHAYIMLDPKHL